MPFSASLPGEKLVMRVVMRIFVLALLLLLGTGCSRAIRIRTPQAQAPGVVSAWMRTVKPTRQGYEAVYYIQNLTGQRLVLMSQDLSCMRNRTKGVIRSKPFDRPNVAVTFNPRQRRGFRISCTGVARRGDSQITIQKISSADAKGAPIQVLAQNIAHAADSRGRPAIPYTVGGINTANKVATRTPPTAAQPPAGPVAPPPSAPPMSTSVGDAIERPSPGPDWIIAIMEVEDVNAASRSKRIDPDLIRNIGDQLRIFIAERGVRTVDKSATERALQEVLQSVKQDSYRDCYADSCQIELGKALAASHILRTKITRFGSRCVLNAELIELRSEVAISAASSRGDCIAEGFLGMSEKVATLITGR